MTEFQRKLLQALSDGYVMYSYPANRPGESAVCKGLYNIDMEIIQPLVEGGYLASSISNGERVYSLTDKGRSVLESSDD